jgi:DNA polymerase III gamma/tau subunit
MNTFDSTNILRKYKPQTVSAIQGQPHVVASLSRFVDIAKQGGSSAAFLFHGPSGTGKTSAAWSLACDLGCDPADPWMSGITEIPSGLQDGTAVDQLLRSLRLRPLFGSGWKVAIVNEADQMTKQAEAIWLDGLEHLPPKSVVVFTTNDCTGLSSRFVSRCEVLEFHGEPAIVGPALAKHVKAVWRQETGKTLRKLPEGLGVFDIAGGQLSFRLALQQIAPYCRSGEDLPARFLAPIVRDCDQVQNDIGRQAAKKAWATRRKAVSA